MSAAAECPRYLTHVLSAVFGAQQVGSTAISINHYGSEGRGGVRFQQFVSKVTAKGVGGVSDRNIFPLANGLQGRGWNHLGEPLIVKPLNRFGIGQHMIRIS